MGRGAEALLSLPSLLFSCWELKGRSAADMAAAASTSRPPWRTVVNDARQGIDAQAWHGVQLHRHVADLESEMEVIESRAREAEAQVQD